MPLPKTSLVASVVPFPACLTRVHRCAQDIAEKVRAQIDASRNITEYMAKLKEAVAIITTVGINASLAVKRDTSLSLTQVSTDMKREVSQCSKVLHSSSNQRQRFSKVTNVDTSRQSGCWIDGNWFKMAGCGLESQSADSTFDERYTAFTTTLTAKIGALLEYLVDDKREKIQLVGSATVTSLNTVTRTQIQQCVDDVLCAASRTMSGGDCYIYVSKLLGWEGVVLTPADASVHEDTTIHINVNKEGHCVEVSLVGALHIRDMSSEDGVGGDVGMLKTIIDETIHYDLDWLDECRSKEEEKDTEHSGEVGIDPKLDCISRRHLTLEIIEKDG